MVSRRESCTTCLEMGICRRRVGLGSRMEDSGLMRMKKRGLIAIMVEHASVIVLVTNLNYSALVCNQLLVG